jgi:hypothetical protein
MNDGYRSVIHLWRDAELRISGGAENGESDAPTGSTLIL